MADTARTTSILEQFDFYHDAPPDLRVDMLQAGQLVSLDAGVFFYHQGQDCPHFAMVGRGELRVFKSGETGRQITLYHVSAGETCIVNMLSAILGFPSAASACVLHPVQAIVFPSSMLRSWVEKHRVVRDYVLTNLAEHLVGVMTLVEEVTFRKLDQRLADYLLERFVPRQGVSMRELRMTHEDIAGELGSVREVIGRLLQDFERRGAIRVARRRIELLDEAVLRQLTPSPEITPQRD